MSRWLRLQLGRGSFDGQRLVSEKNLRETWTRAIDVAPGVGYGLGWMVHDWNGTPMIEHGGNIDGFAAEVAMLPEKGAGFVLLTNVSATPLAAEAQHLVWEALFPTPGADDGAMRASELAPYTGKFRFDQLGVDVAAGHGFDVGDIGAGLGQGGVAAQPVQFAVAAALVFPVHRHFHHLRAAGLTLAGGGGEVLEVLGHPG